MHIYERAMHLVKWGVKGGHFRGQSVVVIHHVLTFPQAEAHADKGVTETY